MNTFIKTFSNISDTKKGEDFSWFFDLNTQIEESKVSRIDIVKACGDIISMWDSKQVRWYEYTLLHAQIERLIELNNLDINNILNFVNKKFKTFKDAMNSFLLSSIVIKQNSLPIYPFFKIRNDQELFSFIETISDFDWTLFLRTFFPKDLNHFFDKISHLETKPNPKEDFSDELSVSIEIDLSSSKQEIYKSFLIYFNNLRNAYLDRVQELSKGKKWKQSLDIQVYSIDPIFTKVD